MIRLGWISLQPWLLREFPPKCLEIHNWCDRLSAWTNPYKQRDTEKMPPRGKTPFAGSCLPLIMLICLDPRLFPSLTIPPGLFGSSWLVAQGLVRFRITHQRGERSERHESISAAVVERSGRVCSHWPLRRLEVHPAAGLLGNGLGRLKIAAHVETLPSLPDACATAWSSSHVSRNAGSFGPDSHISWQGIASLVSPDTSPTGLVLQAPGSHELYDPRCSWWFSQLLLALLSCCF